jgi:hypothetical protein
MFENKDWLDGTWSLDEDKRNAYRYEIWGSHNGVVEDLSLLGCDAVSIGK